MIPNGIFNKKLHVLSVNYNLKLVWLKFTSRASHLLETHLLGTFFLPASSRNGVIGDVLIQTSNSALFNAQPSQRRKPRVCNLTYRYEHLTLFQPYKICTKMWTWQTIELILYEPQ